jgi:hypothetical protein
MNLNLIGWEDVDCINLTNVTLIIILSLSSSSSTLNLVKILGFQRRFLYLSPLTVLRHLILIPSFLAP